MNAWIVGLVVGASFGAPSVVTADEATRYDFGTVVRSDGHTLVVKTRSGEVTFRSDKAVTAGTVKPDALVRVWYHLDGGAVADEIDARKPTAVLELPMIPENLKALTGTLKELDLDHSRMVVTTAAGDVQLVFANPPVYGKDHAWLKPAMLRIGEVVQVQYYVKGKAIAQVIHAGGPPKPPPPPPAAVSMLQP